MTKNEAILLLEQLENDVCARQVDLSVRRGKLAGHSSMRFADAVTKLTMPRVAERIGDDPIVAGAIAEQLNVSALAMGTIIERAVRTGERLPIWENADSRAQLAAAMSDRFIDRLNYWYERPEAPNRPASPQAIPVSPLALGSIIVTFRAAPSDIRLIDIVTQYGDTDRSAYLRQTTDHAIRRAPWDSIVSSTPPDLRVWLLDDLRSKALADRAAGSVGQFERFVDRPDVAEPPAGQTRRRHSTRHTGGRKRQDPSPRLGLRGPGAR